MLECLSPDTPGAGTNRKTQMKTQIKRLGALLAVGGAFVTAAVFGVVSPASAHSPDITGVAECISDGTYTITWTYNANNVPDGVEAETKVIAYTPGTISPIDGVLSGDQLFLSVWNEHQVNVPGAPVKVGNWSATFQTVGIPGNYVGDAAANIQTDWHDGYSQEAYGTLTVDGTCTTPPPTEPPATTPPVEAPPAAQEPPAVQESPVDVPALAETGPASYTGPLLLVGVLLVGLGLGQMLTRLGYKN